MTFYNTKFHNAILFGSIKALNADTVTWIANVAAAAGAVSRLDILAVDAAITYATSAGLYTLIDRWNPRLGDFIACKVAVKTGGVAALDSDFGTGAHFTSSDYNESTGLKGDGSSKALSTNYTPSAGGGNPTGDIALFFFSSPTLTNRSPALAIGSGNSYGFQESTLSPRTFYGLAGQIALGGIFSPGLWHVSRTSNILQTAYLNGISQGTASTTASGAASALALALFCRNNAGSADQFSDHSEIGYAIGPTGFNAAQAAILYNMFVLLNGPQYLNRLPVLPDLFVDYNAGNDFTGTGTTGAPYQTVSKALTSSPIAGGFSIILKDGSPNTFIESTMQGSTSITAMTGSGVPIVATVAGTFVDGQRVAVTSATGNTAANNMYSYAQVTGQTAGTIALYSDQALTTAIVGNGTYTASGVLSSGLGYLGINKNFASPVTIKAQTTNSTNITVQGSNLTGNLYNAVITGLSSNIIWQDIKFNGTSNSLYAWEFSKSAINVPNMAFTRCTFTAPNLTNAAGVRMSINSTIFAAFNNCVFVSPNPLSLAGLYQNGANIRTQINNADTSACASKGLWCQQGITQIIGGKLAFTLIGVDNMTTPGQQITGNMIGSSVAGTGEPLLIGGNSLSFGVYSVRSVGGESIVLKGCSGPILRNTFGGDGTANPILLKGSTNADINSCTFSGIVSGTSNGVINNFDGAPTFQSSGSLIKYCLVIARSAGNVFNWNSLGETASNPSNIVDFNGYKVEGSGNYGRVEGTISCANLAAVQAAWSAGPASQASNDSHSGSLFTVSYNSGGSGQMRYFVIRDATGNNTWNQVTKIFEKTNIANWLIYALPLYEDTAGSGTYVAPFPSEVPAGTVSADQYSCSAWGSQASTDTLATTQIITWAGA